MANNISLELTLGFSNTDFTRNISFGGVSVAALSGIEDAVAAINTSLAGGTDGGLADFFPADDFDDSDSEHIVGKLAGIIDVKSISVADEDIDLNV